MGAFESIWRWQTEMRLKRLCACSNVGSGELIKVVWMMLWLGRQQAGVKSLQACATARRLIAGHALKLIRPKTKRVDVTKSCNGIAARCVKRNNSLYLHAIFGKRADPGPGSYQIAASVAVSLAFLRCESASPPAATGSRKTHVAHRRIKIERVYRPYLTATEADKIAHSVCVTNMNGTSLPCYISTLYKQPEQFAKRQHCGPE
jgi:hypothetical protein